MASRCRSAVAASGNNHRSVQDGGDSTGPWRHIDAVDFATLAWVARRFLPIGSIPPAEYEERYYEQVTVT